LAAAAESRTAAVRTRTRERAAFRAPGEARGITLEVLDGPMDGTILGGDFERIRIGRVSGNDLELHGDRSVSGDHAVLSRTEDPRVWRLEDPRSTNGTWVDDADVRLTGAQTLPADACFMVGHTVIRCAPGVTETFAVDADRLRVEAERLVGLYLFTAAAALGIVFPWRHVCAGQPGDGSWRTADVPNHVLRERKLLRWMWRRKYGVELQSFGTTQ